MKNFKYFRKNNPSDTGTENLPGEIGTSAASEFSFSKEFNETGSEFGENGYKAAEKKDKSSKEALHKKLIRKMSYLVVCVAATATISQTLGDNIQQNVVSYGGSVDGDFRFSIQWNERNETQDDLDAHCIEPGGYEIYYPNRNTASPSGGMLDVDIIDPGSAVAVENIVYADKSTMEDGTYSLFVKCFSKKGGKGGFRAEVEIGGRIYEFRYNKELTQGEKVYVAEVTLQNGRFTIVKLLN